MTNALSLPNFEAISVHLLSHTYSVGAHAQAVKNWVFLSDLISRSTDEPSKLHSCFVFSWTEFVDRLTGANSIINSRQYFARGSHMEDK